MSRSLNRMLFDSQSGVIGVFKRGQASHYLLLSRKGVVRVGRALIGLNVYLLHLPAIRISAYP